MADHLRAAIYCRVSTEDQAREGVSLAAQEERGRAFCQAQGWVVADVYVDDGYSGKNTDRPALKRLIRDGETGAFDLVVVYKLDRLSRRQRDVMHLLEDVFARLGIGFRSVTEAFETATPFGKAALGMLAVFAQLERETIVERSRMGKRQAARQGRWKGGSAPYGYAYEPATRQWSLIPEQVEVYRQIVHWYMAGMGVSKIAKQLNLARVPSPTGTTWSRNTIYKLVHNPHYAGLTHYKGEVYPGQHPAVLTPAEWEQLQAAGENRKGSTWPTSDAFLLSGLLRCGVCGGSIKGKSVYYYGYRHAQPPVHRYYYTCRDQYDRERHSQGHRCNVGWHRVEKVEEVVIQKVLAWAAAPGELAAEVERQLAGSQTRRSELTEAVAGSQKRLDGLEQKLKRWYDAYEQGAIGASQLRERTESLRRQQEGLLRQVGAWREELAALPAATEEYRRLAEQLGDVRALWESATRDQRRQWLRLIIRSGTLHRDGTVELDII